MILDAIAKAFHRLAGINVPLRDPSAAVLAYGLLDATTNEAALFLSNGVLYDKTGNPVMNFGGSASGAGGAVTQATSSSTGVEIDTVTGQITTVALTTAAGAEEVFTVTNSKVAATDIPVVSTTYAGAGTPAVTVKKVAAGAFDIVITNLHASAALNAALVINFAVIKGSAS